MAQIYLACKAMIALIYLDSEAIIALIYLGCGAITHRSTWAVRQWSDGWVSQPAGHPPGHLGKSILQESCWPTSQPSVECSRQRYLWCREPCRCRSLTRLWSESWCWSCSECLWTPDRLQFLKPNFTLWSWKCIKRRNWKDLMLDPWRPITTPETSLAILTSRVVWTTTKFGEHIFFTAMDLLSSGPYTISLCFSFILFNHPCFVYFLPAFPPIFPLYH